MAVSIWALLGYLAPAYSRPPSYSERTQIEHQVDAQFDFFARLHGFDIGSTVVRPGQAIDLTLYWEVLGQPPGDYLMFVHVIDDETGEIIAQRDTHPGLGKFPTSQWRKGDRIVESVRIHLPVTTYEPAKASITVGLYAPNSYRLAINGADGQRLGDALPLSSITVIGSGELPNRQDHDFNRIARLVGYELNQRLLLPGQPLQVDLWWQREQPGTYIVHVELLTENGGLIDAVEYPLPETDVKQRVMEQYTLLADVPPQPPGQMRLKLFLLDTQNRARQNIVAEDGHWIDDHLMLSNIRILMPDETQ